MGCTASRPVVGDLPLGPQKPGTAGKHGTNGSSGWRGDSAERYANGHPTAEKPPLESLQKAQQMQHEDDQQQQQTKPPAFLSPFMARVSFAGAAEAKGSRRQLDASSSARRSDDEASSAGSPQRPQQQQKGHQDVHPERPKQRGVTDSAGSAEVREQRANAVADAAPAPASAAEAAHKLIAAASSSLSSGDGERSSCASVSLSHSGEDTVSEMTCSGQAMSRLSAAFTRRLSRTDERGSAELQRRQSLSYMKEVDAIVQSFDIQEGEITIERKPDGSEWVLGHGSYGQVYKALRGGVQDVAIKVLFDADENALRNFIKEISLLKSLNYDRNIVQFYGARLRAGHIPMMVLEYMEGGDLRSAIDADFNGQLKWNSKGYNLALDIAKGIHFLHAHNVIHSDIKSSNILLDRSKTTAKISDVGLARVMEKHQYRSSDEHAWTFVYAAPEMLMGKPCTDKSDIYSFGVCLWEIVMREIPVRGRLTKPTCPDDCPEAIAELISQCLKTDPTVRPSARQVHDAIKQAHSSAVTASAWFA